MIAAAGVATLTQVNVAHVDAGADDAPFFASRHERSDRREQVEHQGTADPMASRMQYASRRRPALGVTGSSSS